jgi:hypothetical protein
VLLLPTLFGVLGLVIDGSPFHGMLIYQRRTDRRIIVIARDQLPGNSSFSGKIYGKWGRLVIAGMGTFNSRFVVGSM